MPLASVSYMIITVAARKCFVLMSTFLQKRYILHDFSHTLADLRIIDIKPIGFIGFTLC